MNTVKPKVNWTAAAVPSPAGKPEKKVAIIGFTNSRHQAPWGQPDWELWLCNNLWKFSPSDNWHRLYDLHDDATIDSDIEQVNFLAGETLKKIDGSPVSLNGRPVYCWKPRETWKSAIAYPKDQVNQLFGRYFSNSISWMIAHAIIEGATELHIYGVDMAQGSEYAAQRPSCEYFLGVAAGMGIKVYVPPQSDLLKVSAMYGAEDDSALYAKIAEREGELKERMQAMQNQMNQTQLQLAQLQGAIETTQYFKSVWTNPRAERDGSAKSVNGKVETPMEVVNG